MTWTWRYLEFPFTSNSTTEIYTSIRRSAELTLHNQQFDQLGLQATYVTLMRKQEAGERSWTAMWEHGSRRRRSWPDGRAHPKVARWVQEEYKSRNMPFFIKVLGTTGTMAHRIVNHGTNLVSFSFHLYHALLIKPHKCYLESLLA